MTYKPLKQQSAGTAIAVLHYLAIYLMAFYLLADMLSGVAIVYAGLDLKVSLLYKMPLFVLLLLLIGRYNLNFMLGVLIAIVILMIGPVASYYKVLRLDILFADFAYAVKVIMPAVVMLYFFIMSKQAPEWTLKWIKFILLSGFIILLINFFLGALGFGNATYSVGSDNEESAGSTGFVMAGNELGAVYLLLFGYALHQVWNNLSRIFYVLLVVVTIACGILVATKTTMLASMILVFIIPIVNERQNLYKFTWLKIKVFLPLALTSICVVIMIFDILESIGLLERIMFFYEKRGLIMIIWSGRDQFISDLMNAYIYNSNLLEQLFGQGSAIGLKHIYGKSSAEVDFVDALTWFGFFGLSMCSFFYLFLLIKSYKLAISMTSKYAPCLFLVNSLLLLLSILSGHIWMSGTLGIAVGVFNSLLWFDSKKITP